jgi:endonuclease/exonuclease/phosphatase (EEP) superfamily protein YafD
MSDTSKSSVEPFRTSLSSLRVATFNLNCDENNATSVAKLLHKLDLDIVLLQETIRSSDGCNTALQIAERLGLHHISLTRSNMAILWKADCRGEILSQGKHYGLVRIGNLFVMNLHFNDYPYIPFEAFGIPYCKDKCFYSDDAGVLGRRALAYRKKDLKFIEKALEKIPEGSSIIIGGDFNEPSYRDWGHWIMFPTAMFLERKWGFADVYRSVNCDEGITWPDGDPGYEHRADRIDFLFAKNLAPLRSKVIMTGLSDHGMVVGELQIPRA